MPPKKRMQKVGAVNYQRHKAISGVRADEDRPGQRDVVVEGGVRSGETMVQARVGSGEAVVEGGVGSGEMMVECGVGSGQDC